MKAMTIKQDDGTERRVRDPAEQKKVIDAARERARKRVLRHEQIPYLIHDEGMLTEIRCKCCGVAIAALRELDRVVDDRWLSDRREIVKLAALRTLPSHRQVRLIFDDGSAHETECCTSCLAKMTLEDAEAMYAGDLAQFLDDELCSGDEIPWHALADRCVTRFETIHP